jgi:hypothetical protein
VEDLDDRGLCELTEDGGIWVPEGAEPMRLRVGGPGIYPLRVDVGPEEPEAIRLPAGGLVGQVRSDDGRPLSAVVYVDAHRYEFPDGRIAVRGVPAGPHLVLVGARDHVGEALRIVLGEGETRRLEVRLPGR